MYMPHMKGLLASSEEALWTLDGDTVGVGEGEDGLRCQLRLHSAARWERAASAGH